MESKHEQHGRPGCETRIQEYACGHYRTITRPIDTSRTYEMIRREIDYESGRDCPRCRKAKGES